jgi:hypothetical protein
MKSIDVLPDNQNAIVKNGVTVRKGSVAAFIANAEIILNEASSAEEKSLATADIKELIHMLEAVGVFKVFELKSDRIKDIIYTRSNLS